MNDDWERRVAEIWASFDDDTDPETFVARIERLVSELPQPSAIADFERACAFDSTGRPDRAVQFYMQAIEGGLTGARRRRAVIQLASSLRNLERPHEAIRLLETELEEPHDALTGAVRGFLALALTDAGREREAVAIALEALSEYLPRYNGSLARYAKALTQ